jgi:selenocysteine lyase/cysteine desulfurase
MLLCQKDKFSLHPDIHYFNNARKGPLLKSSEAAAIKSLVQQRNPSDLPNSGFFEEMDVVKKMFGQLVNCEAKNVAVIPAVSYGFSSVLNNTPAKKNGHAITLRDEFPSGYLSLEKWCKTNDNDLKVIGPDQKNVNAESWNNNILESINQNTSVVLMCSVHWMNGLKYDLEAIGEKCKEVGARFYLDGTQSVGAMPIDVKKYNVDALVCGTYKWMFGPYSVGLSYMSDIFNDGQPLEESWMNRVNAKDFTSLTSYNTNYFEGASRYSVGETSNFILMSMLVESLKQILEWKPENIQSYCKELIQPFKQFMHENDLTTWSDAYFSNHLFSLKLPDEISIDSLKASFSANKIYASQRGTGIRLSINVFNEPKNIDVLIKCIKKVL